MQRPKSCSILFITFLILTACATTQPLTGDISSREVSDAFKPGSELVIFTRDGYQYLVIVASIEEDQLVGKIKLEEEHRSSSEEIRLDYRDIERIEPVTETGLAEKAGDVAVKTGAVVAGGGIVIIGYAALYTLYTAIVYQILKGFAW